VRHRYGNAINVKRSVAGYAAAGFAGILIEDQVWPKSCGHVKGKQVVERHEAVSRIRAAVDARCDAPPTVVVTDAPRRTTQSILNCRTMISVTFM
jgi:2-methylisocitrate lyase-like PEP mutase family enzyme